MDPVHSGLFKRISKSTQLSLNAPTSAKTFQLCNFRRKCPIWLSTFQLNGNFRTSRLSKFKLSYFSSFQLLVSNSFQIVLEEIKFGFLSTNDAPRFSQKLIFQIFLWIFCPQMTLHDPSGL